MGEWRRSSHRCFGIRSSRYAQYSWDNHNLWNSKNIIFQRLPREYRLKITTWLVFKKYSHCRAAIACSWWTTSLAISWMNNIKGNAISPAKSQHWVKWWKHMDLWENFYSIRSCCMVKSRLSVSSISKCPNSARERDFPFYKYVFIKL